jgi:hypothetical protein
MHLEERSRSALNLEIHNFYEMRASTTGLKNAPPLSAGQTLQYSPPPPSRCMSPKPTSSRRNVAVSS